MIGRGAELARLDQLINATAAGAGGLLVVVGAPGSGKSALLGEGAAMGRRRGLSVLGGSPPAGSPGQLVWAQLLRELGGSGDLADRLLERPASSDQDAAVRRLAGAEAHLLVVDDIDRGGSDALELLAMLAGRLVVGSTGVLISASTPLGIGPEMRLGPLTEDELTAVVGVVPQDVRHAVWVASGGMPGAAQSLAGQLVDLPRDEDPLVYLALRARSAARFLDVDIGVVRLLEAALDRTDRDGVRARLLARLARELLGDAAAGPRRQTLVDDALALARADGDRQALAEALDARLYALWNAAGAQDRLDVAAQIIDLARAAGDQALERSGLFWRFTALMELARVAEAESTLAAFARLARAGGDAGALVMVTARQAMLATLRGRFDQAAGLTDEVADQGRRTGLADTVALVGTLRGAVIMLREDPSAAIAGLQPLSIAARLLPGNFFEASAARVLTILGRLSEASAELERMLPQVLTGSGPRWVGALADLSVVAAATGNIDAAEQLYEALLPYRARLVIWGGANTVTGPVAHYLGLLATLLGRLDAAVDLLSEAIALEETIGALPWRAHSLAALADTLARRGRDGDTARGSKCQGAARLAAERLDLTGLLARLVPPADEWTLRRDAGGDWLLEAGDERARLRDSRGLRQLRALLAAPRIDVAALDLAAGGAGLIAPGTTPMLDQSAIAAYRARLAGLEDALDTADRAGDARAAVRANAERAALVQELRRASGLAGRVRHASGESERARVNVTRTLRTTLNHLSEVAPRAAAHLQASIRTGLSCRYDPAPGGPTHWHL